MGGQVPDDQADGGSGKIAQRGQVILREVGADGHVAALAAPGNAEQHGAASPLVVVYEDIRERLYSKRRTLERE